MSHSKDTWKTKYSESLAGPAVCLSVRTPVGRDGIGQFIPECKAEEDGQQGDKGSYDNGFL